ncbi:MAG: biotin transporter BioY [Desulfurococcaceae archaeon]
MRRRKQLVVPVVIAKSRSSQRFIVMELVRVAISVLTLSLGARIKITAPFTPVPFTLQTMVLHCLLFTNGAQAWRYVATYVLLGLIGAPVFAYGGGLAYVLSPTFGYLIGFIAGTLVAGRLVPKGTLSAKRGLIAGLAQLMIIYALGASWLTAWYAFVGGINFLQAIITATVTGVMPFIPWDIAKLCLAIPLSRLTVITSYALLRRLSSSASSKVNNA